MAHVVEEALDLAHSLRASFHHVHPSTNSKDDSLAKQLLIIFMLPFIMFIKVQILKLIV